MFNDKIALESKNVRGNTPLSPLAQLQLLYHTGSTRANSSAAWRVANTPIAP